MVGDLVKSSAIWWDAGLMAATSAGLWAVYLNTGLEPDKFAEPCFLTPLLAGLSGLPNIAPSAVVRAQVRFKEQPIGGPV